MFLNHTLRDLYSRIPLLLSHFFSYPLLQLPCLERIRLRNAKDLTPHRLFPSHSSHFRYLEMSSEIATCCL